MTSVLEPTTDASAQLGPAPVYGPKAVVAKAVLGRILRQVPVTISGAVWGGGETPALKGMVDPETIILAGSAIGRVSPKSNRITGAVKHGDLAHDARPLHKHLVDFTCPVRRGRVTEVAIKSQTGVPPLDAWTHP